MLGDLSKNGIDSSALHDLRKELDNLKASRNRVGVLYFYLFRIIYYLIFESWILLFKKKYIFFSLSFYFVYFSLRKPKNIIIIFILILFIAIIFLFFIWCYVWNEWIKRQKKRQKKMKILFQTNSFSGF